MLIGSRTTGLLFILHLLFDIKPEQRTKARVGLSDLPLPAHKLLWQASQEQIWELEYDKMLTRRQQGRYLRYRDLVALGNESGPSGDLDSTTKHDLDTWMVSGDQFGLLVTMAATIL